MDKIGLLKDLYNSSPKMKLRKFSKAALKRKFALKKPSNKEKQINDSTKDKFLTVGE